MNITYSLFSRSVVISFLLPLHIHKPFFFLFFLSLRSFSIFSLFLFGEAILLSQ